MAGCAGLNLREGIVPCALEATSQTSDRLDDFGIGRGDHRDGARWALARGRGS